MSRPGGCLSTGASRFSRSRPRTLKVSQRSGASKKRRIIARLRTLRKKLLQPRLSAEHRKILTYNISKLTSTLKIETTNQRLHIIAACTNNMQSIDKIVAGTWKDVRLLNRLNENLRSGRLTRRDFLGRAAAAAATVIAAPYLINGARADDPLPESNGKTYDVDNSMTCEKINQIITDANGGDKYPDDPLRRDIIHFQAGQYNLSIIGPSQNETYLFLPDRNYVFNPDGVTIQGGGIEHTSLIKIRDGGNMNIAGNLTAGNSIMGIWIGTVPFKNIDISGINFRSVYEYSIVYQNIQHESPLTEAAVRISYCTADSGIKCANFARAPPVDEKSPYPRVESCTVRDLSGWGVDLPSWRVPTGTTAGSGYTKIVLGQNDVNDNVWVNCDALADPTLYTYFSSPKRNRYQDVNQPFIGEPDDDNAVVGADDFYEDTLYPIMFGGAHLGNGNAAGAHPLVATMGSLEYFVNRYLTTPDSPDWDPRADFDGDGVVTLTDFAELANKWYRAESGLIAKAAPFIDKSIIERALTGEPNYRRLLEDIRTVA
jgi:hypothetical protein